MPSNSKVLYGTDDRLDLYQISDPTTRALATSTCALMSSSRLTDNGNGTFDIFTSEFRQFGVQGCTSEPFRTQPTAAYCTGFRVGEKLIATAGHCFNSGDLNSTRFVFGYVMQDAATPVKTVSASRVYTAVRIVGRQLAGGLDYAIVEVDREITAPGAAILPIRRTGTVPLDQRVGVIGHPAGLPLKIAFGPSTRVKQNGNSGYFEANLDTYGGNSGSPVFNQDTGVVEGILVRGETDYLFKSNCFVSNQLADSAGAEECSKTTTFMQFIPEVVVTAGDHSADSNGNNKLDLTEILRVIQLYNVRQFGCDTKSEDKFSVLATDQTCNPHSGDYAPQNWEISLPELLRMLQMYNSGGYVLCQGGEDGFCLPQ